MTLFKILFLSLICAEQVLAQPFLISDPTTQDVSHFGIYIDNMPATEYQVAINDSGGRYVKYDLANFPSGLHTITATFINYSVIDGRQESVRSNPFTFTRQLTLEPPAGLVVTP